MFDSDISTLPHYSTPISRSPTQENPPPPPPAQQQQLQQKRPTRAPLQNNISTKRSKSDVQNVRIKTSPARSELEMTQDDEETDYIEAPPSLKVDEEEQPKQFFESNGNGTVVETNTQDQGRCWLVFCFVLLAMPAYLV